MQAGDLIRFNSTGKVGTILNIGREFVDDPAFSAKVFIHGWIAPRGTVKNPALFRLAHLREIAEVINAAR